MEETTLINMATWTSFRTRKSLLGCSIWTRQAFFVGILNLDSKLVSHKMEIFRLLWIAFRWILKQVRSTCDIPIRFRWSRKIDPFILKSLAVDLMKFLGVHHSWTNLGYLILVWISLRIWTFRGKRLPTMDPTSARQPSGLGSLRLGKRLGCWLVRSCRSTTLSTVVELAMNLAEQFRNLTGTEFGKLATAN